MKKKGAGRGALYGYFRYVLEKGLETRPLSLLVGFRERKEIGPPEELGALEPKYSNFK